MFNNLPLPVRNRIIELLKADDFKQAKALRDAYLNSQAARRHAHQNAA